MRRKYTEVEKDLMKNIANNLKRILKEKGLTQRDLAEMSDFSTSAISDYMTGKTLLSPGSLQILASALKVDKGEIDPTYKSAADEERAQYIVENKLNPFLIFELVDKYSDEEIIEKYHHQGNDGGELSENQIKLHLQYVRFLKTQKK